MLAISTLAPGRNPVWGEIMGGNYAYLKGNQHGICASQTDFDSDLRAMMLHQEHLKHPSAVDGYQWSVQH